MSKTQMVQPNSKAWTQNSVHNEEQQKDLQTIMEKFEEMSKTIQNNFNYEAEEIGTKGQKQTQKAQETKKQLGVLNQLTKE
jgi:hypothetical protein